MRNNWAKDLECKRVELIVADRGCPCCGKQMTICDHRRRCLYTFEGPLELVCKLVHCPDQQCSSRPRTFSPPAELAIAPPNWMIGWDVFAWIGHRRFARHWSVPQIRSELLDSHDIRLSADAIEGYVHRYQIMLAARQHDIQVVASDYQNIRELVLAIDGLQPEKGHETLYVVREINARRVWFAQPLLSSTAAEIQPLFARAKLWAQSLGKPVRLWMSDKQEAFLKGVEAEFPGIPHRYCANHFVRDLAKPLLEEDSHAKVRMRKKVRGLRTIEQEVLADRRERLPGAQDASEFVSPQAFAENPLQPLVERSVEENTARLAPARSNPAIEEVDPDGEVVLAYCSAMRGILNDDQGGPLHPPGLRMAEALQEVKESIDRNVAAQKGAGRKPVRASGKSD